MAGLGSRFKRSGFIQQKPLIHVGTKPMYRRAVDSLPLNVATHIVFVVRRNEFSQCLINDIKTVYAPFYNCNIVELDEDSQGPAESVFRCSLYLDLNVPTLIHHCDTYIETDFDWRKLIERTIDGALVLFNSKEECWSYAKLDESELKIIDMQEKKISNHASTGTYYFKKTPNLLEDIELIMAHDWRENNGFYLSTVYKVMISSGKHVIPLWAKKALCFETPANLGTSLNEMLFTKPLVNT